ncbi:hypothetical protein ARAM_001012 [Aspergillus rambellii]|uniref:Peptidase C14 caspase domain-containing protein n=1 Tax=Aspergillus rambellii TaxID=308745 RepID=A0A0F8VTF1_9EURO|nr:hypothetical protein ARAM_001012 [Aspergillus rambellii]
MQSATDMSNESMPPSSLAVGNFRQLMEKLVDQHHRQFCHSLSLSISWEDDNTNASQDIANFQAILRIFGYTEADEYVIPSQAPTPGWEVSDKIWSLLRKAMAKSGRTIILIHYAGHGVKWNDKLHFCNGAGNKRINVDREILGLVDSNSALPDSASVDVVFLFDSCYSYLATRNYTAGPRVVEVLAAVDESSQLAFAPGRHASFTGKVYAELIKRKQSGATNVELAELHACLRKTSPVKKPAHRLIVGVNSLRLLIPQNNQPTLTYEPAGPATYAVFSFRIADSLSTESIKNFSDWVGALPKDVGLALENVYNTQSMCLIFRAPWAFWCKVNGLDFVQFICETTSPNLLSTARTVHPRSPVK